jgi:hypothetical protein
LREKSRIGIPIRYSFDYSLLDTLLKVAVRLLPTALKAAIAATAIRAAISPYSIAVAPSSFFKSLFKTESITAVLL